jgi:hypothetical protein
MMYDNATFEELSNAGEEPNITSFFQTRLRDSMHRKLLTLLQMRTEGVPAIGN